MMSLHPAGCLGCSFCEDKPLNTLEEAQLRKKTEDKLRSEGKPTLHVKFGDLLRASLKG